MINSKLKFSKLIFALSICVIFVFSCKPNPKAVAEKQVAEVLNIPDDLQSVMNAHGGLDKWKTMRAMSYEMPKEEGAEKQFIDLWDRRERIEAPNYSMGFDGNNFWTDADTTVKQNPIFYKNLMFYFYAMPFVLADDGILYEKVENLIFDDVEYPGYRISYNQGVGVSPEDEYFIHYDAKTKEMAWLGYTVTYYSQEKSTKIKWIRYDDWQEVGDLKLPASMMWYKNEENKPSEERSRRAFNNVKLSKEPFKNSKFEATEAARIVAE